MTPERRGEPVVFCDDAMLGYQRSRAVFAPDATLALDEAYRLAHLPLVAPDHPGVIARREGTSYEMGRHPRIHSLVLPFDGTALQASPAFGVMEAALRASPFAARIAWDLLLRRIDRLHATIVGSLAVGEAPVLTAAQRKALRSIGPFAVQLRGLFCGTINRGRLYLRAYPQLREGRNPFHAIQAAMGRATTDLYLVGIYNLVDDLDRAETAALSQLLERFWQTPLLTVEANALALLGSCDDLVLDASVSETVPLSGNHFGDAGGSRP